MLPSVSRDQIEAALAKFDAEHRDSPEFAGWEVKESQRFGLRFDGRLYPPKKIVSLATAVPVSGFSGGRETNEYLAARGFAVEYINLPPENEVRIALHELLLERAPEGVQPSVAYRLLAERLQLPPPLLKKRLGDGEGESHWENRVRFARRKLVTEGRLDGTERGVWRLATRQRRIWIEKTIVADRADRERGDYALGKALWSPRWTRGDSDAYSAMRDVQPADLIVHLIDNRSFAGVSVVASTARTDFVGLPGTDWAELPAYLVMLRDFTPCAVAFTRDKFLEVPSYETELRRIRSAHKHLFYDKDPTASPSVTPKRP